MIPSLPRRAWIVLSGDALSALGTGLTLPFFVVYLHRVRGIDLELVGLALSTIALAGFAGNPLGGWLTDRAGARLSLIGGLLCAATGALLLAFVTSAADAFLAAATLGLGEAIIWPSIDSLLARSVSAQHRSAVFSIRYATVNAGFGVGGLVAAAVADASSVGTFQILYVVDAASFLAFIPFLVATRELREPEQPSEAEAQASWRVVFRDRAFVRLWLLTALLVAIGYSQMNSAFPTYVTGEGGLSAGQLGVIFAANTLTVVAAQLVTLRVMSGHRRTTALVFVCVFWGASWAATLATGRLASGAVAVMLFAGASIVFAIGETALSPSLFPMVNDLAPDDLRGRYNGIFTLAWTTGFLIGPTVSGLALARGFFEEFFTGLVLACGLGAIMAARLPRLVPAAANIIETEDEAFASETTQAKRMVVCGGES